MQSINIEQYEFDGALKHFFMLNPTYEWAGNVHGSFKDAVKDNVLFVDSVGMVRAIYEMVTGQTLDNLPNVPLMASETDYIPFRNACPGDLVFSNGAVSMVVDENSQLMCYSGDKGVTVENRTLTRGVDEVHRGFIRVSVS